MLAMAEKGNFLCALLDDPEELSIYATANIACQMDKVANPSVDDEGANQILKNARREGIHYWQKRYDSGDLISLILFDNSKSKQKIIGMANVNLPTLKNETEYPLMCSAHILHSYRSIGLSKLLLDSCVKFIADHTEYNEIYVQARENNEVSIRGLTRKGFTAFKQDGDYITFVGKTHELNQNKLVPPIPSYIN